MRSAMLRRVIAAIATVMAVLTLSFVAIHAAPGTPFMPRGDRPPLDSAAVARLQAKFGLDQPVPVQYAKYVAALAHGELGESFSQRRPVATMLADAIPNTLELTATALAIEMLLGLALGAFQGARAGSKADGLLTHLSLFLFAMPTFWLGLLLLLLFGEKLHWLPVGGVVDPIFHEQSGLIARILDRMRHLILPAATLGLVGAAGTARFQRSAVIEALKQDYVRTARAKGLSSWQALTKHALRNALLPYITIFGLALPFLLTGAVVVESVFAWPGMGKLAADAIATRDYPVVAATTLIASALVVIGSVIADLLYRVADPRSQHEHAT